MLGLTLIGAIVAVLVYSLTIGVFVRRLNGRPDLEHWLGLALIALALPLLYLLLRWRVDRRAGLHLLQLSLMIAYLVTELLLDYVFRYDFRGVRWMTIGYTTLFLAATGGMIGVASHAGKGWAYVSIVLFLVMGVLAFLQRGLTGM